MSQSKQRQIVRFREGIISPDVKVFDHKALPAPGARIDELSRALLMKLLLATESATYTRVFSELTPDAFQALVDRAKERNPHYVAPDLYSHYYVDGPAASELSKLGELFSDKFFDKLIACTGRASSGGSPTLDPDVLANWDRFSHLHVEPRGTGAEHAWNHVSGGGYGAGMRFADIECVEPKEHKALNLDEIAVFGNEWDAQELQQDHATAVLGVVLADPAVGGAIGAAPGVASARVVSNIANGKEATADRIAVAAGQLRRGDVLLIEYELREAGYHPTPGRKVGVPVESDFTVRDAIRLATDAGVVVIEPGGNGDQANFGMNLDTIRRGDGTNMLRGDPLFRDSGAIVVSAAEFDEGVLKNRRLRWAPYGSRVDCYARGIGVAACRIQNGDDAIVQDFGGTSSAAAIIAGTALQVQGIALSKNNAPLDPEDLRELFADSLNGTEAEIESPARQIGPMPDLEKLLERLPSAFT